MQPPLLLLPTQARAQGCLPLENFDRPCFLVVVDVVVVVVVVVVLNLHQKTNTSTVGPLALG